MKTKYFVLLSSFVFFLLSTTFASSLSEKELANVSFDDGTSETSTTSQNKENTEDNNIQVLEITKEQNQEEQTIDNDGWDLSKVDTARNVNYLTEIEKDVILETNKARTNPAKYAKLYIEPTFKLYSGKYYKEPGKITLVTNEGLSAAKECYYFLLKQTPCEPLQPGEGLAKAAKEHATEQGKTSKTGHNGANGSTPFTRMKKYCSYGYAGENISYGCETGREIILQLIIDDGVANRGHRKNTFQTTFTHVGVGFYSHKKYGYECVLDYAENYKEKTN